MRWILSWPFKLQFQKALNWVRIERNIKPEKMAKLSYLKVSEMSFQVN